MALNPKSEIRDVAGIKDEEWQRIVDFLQGAVYCWCKNRKGEWFALRDLVGGDNTHWQGTPLIALYKKHKKKGKSADPSIPAGRDAGWLLKTVLDDDKRTFDTKVEAQVRHYRWHSKGRKNK